MEHIKKIRKGRTVTWNDKEEKKNSRLANTWWGMDGLQV